MDKIYTFWQSNPNIWFNSTPDDDKYIYDNYIDYLLIFYNTHNMNKNEWTSYCILYDQLLKHINRYINNLYAQPENFIENCYINYNKFKDELSDFEFMFCLMPIRHTHQLTHVKFVLKETWSRLELNKTNQFIKKFLTATYERYIKCTTEHNLINYISNDYISNEIGFIHDDILDKISCTSRDVNNVLTVSNNSLNIYMDDFVKNYNLTNDIIIVSLSGGVDSMVCSYLLNKLKERYVNLVIYAVHIDYYNRTECEKEEQLLIWWCNDILRIPLYIRRIDEINRPKCMEYELRDLYESYTKDVRFNSYININNNNNNNNYNINIVLGHNKDDTIENILTNTASQSHYENLLGMTPISYQSYKEKNICFLRPLINIPKSEIYQYAIDNNIPFLQDSTPKWSQRGKIRDIVKPALNEWNPLFFDGLINLSAKMGQMTLLLDKLISADINNKYNNINEVPIDSIYWTTVLKKNNIHITQKTLINLINRIEHYQKFPHKLRDAQKIQLAVNKNGSNVMLVLKQSYKPVERLHINFCFI
jgi:tRNA(Ile)-lysidine synthetase-like protein